MTVSPAKVAEPILMPFGMLTRVVQGPKSRSPMQRGSFEGDDVEIFPHAGDQHSDWQATEAIECH